jgi:rod shape-determining protein MreC
MSQFQFKHVAIALMGLSFISVFLVPPRFTNPARAELAGLFSPISRPVRGVSSLIYGRFHHETIIDEVSPQSPRSDQTLLAENQRLSIQLESLQARFEELSKLNSDRHLVGDILPLCRPATVTGADSSAGRDSMQISASLSAGLAKDRPVLHAQNLVGRTVSAGLGSAQVRLITDPGFAIMCRIAQYRFDDTGARTPHRIEDLPVLVRGIGNGLMAVCSNLSYAKIHEKGIALNDLLVLADPDWPANVQGLCVGKIADIRPQAKAPLLSNILVEPQEKLIELNEVMVMVKD